MTDTGEHPRRSWFWLVAMAIAALAAAQALALCLHHDLAVDEPFMARVLADPRSIPRVLADDNVPLAYALWLAWTTVAGASPLALRSLSICAYAVGCLFVADAGRRAGGDRAGLLAALLVACSGIGLQHAAAARPYAIVALFAAVALWADAVADDEPGRRGVALIFVPHLLGLFTHPMFVFVSAASAGARLLASGRRRVLAAGPLLAIGVYVASWSWMLARTLRLATTSWMPRPSVRNLVSGYTHLWGIAGGVLLAVLAAAGAAALVRRRDRVPAAVVRAALVAMAVLLGAFVVSQVRPMYLSPRTPVFVLPMAALAMAWLIAASRTRALAVAAAVIAGAGSLTASIDAARAPDPTPTRASLAIVASAARCGDVVVAAGMSYAALDYYARPAGLPACIRIVAFPADVAQHPGWPDMRPGFDARLRAEAPADADALDSYARVWLFRSPGGLGLEAGAAIASELARKRAVVQRWPLTGSFFEEVTLFGRAS